MTKENGKIKNHFKKHKNKYLITVGIIGVGGLGFYAGAKFRETNSIDNSKDMVIKNIVAKDINIKQNDNSVNKFINIIQNSKRKGHAGNLVYCPELDRYFNSQNEAETECGIPRGSVSKILKGAREHAKGLTFEKVGDFNSDKPKIVEELK